MKNYLLKKQETYHQVLKAFRKRKLEKENIKTCWKKYLQVYQSIQFCIKKKKQTKYNTADQIVDMQAINFVLMKLN